MNFYHAFAIVFGTFHECHSADIHQFVMKTDGVRGGNSANAPGVPIDLETSASAQRLAFPAAPRPAPAAPIENEEAIKVSAQESDGLARCPASFEFHLLTNQPSVSRPCFRTSPPLLPP